MAPSRLLLPGFCLLLAGCSGIRFSSIDDGKSHPYRVASPALKVVTAPDCTMTAEVISIPGRLNYLSFQTGLGKINDTIEFEPGGTIKRISASQEGVAVDLGKVIGAVTGIPKTIGARGFNNLEQRGCPPSVAVYPIKLDAEGNPYVDQSRPMIRGSAAIANHDSSEGDQ